jgi:hypothetical protein
MQREFLPSGAKQKRRRNRQLRQVLATMPEGKKTVVVRAVMFWIGMSKKDD